MFKSGGSSERYGLSGLFMVSALLLLLSSAAAQEVPTENDTTAEAEAEPELKPEPSEIDRTRQDLARLDELRDSIRQIESQKGIEGEERKLLRLEALKILEEFDGLTAKLAKGLTKTDSATAFTDSVKNITVAHLEYLGRLYGRVIDIPYPRQEIELSSSAVSLDPEEKES